LRPKRSNRFALRNRDRSVPDRQWKWGFACQKNIEHKWHSAWISLNCHYSANLITRQLLSTDKDSLSDHIARVRAFAAGQLGNLQRMAAKDRTKAKLELRKHLSAIRMEPQPVDGKGVLRG
jgi:hypothetical protein